jgi:hypothetical protein
MYKVPPSVRGRLIGNYISTGWYTYRDNPLRSPGDPNQIAVWDDDNAIILADTTTEAGHILGEWFRTQFEQL